MVDDVRGKMYEGSQKSREGSSTKEWSVASLTWRYKVWRCIRNLSDPLSEIWEPRFLIIQSMIAGIRTYVYNPLEVARAESSR